MITTIFLLIIGLAIGSFLGALTYRLPRKIKISKGRSKCPNCKKQISWFDNIPLLSFLILKGKCRSCKQKISIRYPLIEAITAISFVLIGVNPVNLLLACILISIFVIDIEHQLIFDEFVFIGLFVVFLNLIVLNSPFLFTNLLAGFLAALVLLFLHIITKGNGMGLGDVKLALLLGSLTGLKFLLIWLFFSFAIGAITGIILMAAGYAKMKQKIAFGPFLITGLLLTYLFGSQFISLLNL